MNQTALSLQVDSFKNLIEAASTRSAVNRKPYTNGFKYIPTDNARTWETEKAVFRHFTVFLDAKERGAFIETAGSAGAKRYNWSTTIRLVFVYPLHAGDDALRLADISSADDMLVTSIIENPANRVYRSERLLCRSNGVYASRTAQQNNDHNGQNRHNGGYLRWHDS
jgi:hypothetical protein